jgi:chromosome segregation ATPase
MTDNNTDTASDGAGTPVEGDTSAAEPATPDELAALKSRNSGLNAKVTDLQKQLVAEREGRTAAEQAAAGKAGTDDVLNRRIAALEAELTAGKQAVALAQKGAKYPEAFAELGDDIANMSSEKLAALEARLTSAKDSGDVAETPKPVGNNPSRTTGTKNIEDMTSAELQAAIKALPREAFGLAPR